MHLDSLNLAALLFGIIPILIFLYWLYGKKRYNLPPGPVSLPIVGYLPFLGEDPFKTYQTLAEKHGNVFGLYLGSSYTVVLNDNLSSKEALNNVAVLDRPPGLFDFIPDSLGFAGLNGAEWVEQRRFSMKVLKDAGMSKISWESDVQAEIDDFLKIIDSYNGQPVNLLRPLSASVSNNMTSIVLGKRLPMGDSRREVVDTAIITIVQVFAMSVIATYMPSLLLILIKLGISKYAEGYSKLTAFNDFIRNEVRQRKGYLDQPNENIFIDDYLSEIRRNKEKLISTHFNESMLAGNAQSILTGGSETVRTSLLWLFLAMAAFPDLQKRIQEEIDKEIGRDGKLVWMNRSQLPYTYATVMEAQRWRTVVPINVPRRTSESICIAGFDIPKNTVVLINIWALHNDVNYWREPEKFDPSRFLKKDGSLITSRPDSYMPFSIGRRNCPGEIIALMEIFHYLVAILQKFEIKRLEDSPPDLRGHLEAATFQPVQQKLRFMPRD